MPYFYGQFFTKRPSDFFIGTDNCDRQNPGFCHFSKCCKSLCYFVYILARIPCPLREKSEHPRGIFYGKSGFYCGNFYLVTLYGKSSAPIHKFFGKKLSWGPTLNIFFTAPEPECVHTMIRNSEWSSETGHRKVFSAPSTTILDQQTRRKPSTFSSQTSTSKNSTANQ